MRSLIEVLGVVAAFFGVTLYASACVPVANDYGAGSSVLIKLDDSHGSGVVIAPGRVLTAGHVVDGADTVKVTLPNGHTQIAHVLWHPAPGRDVALLSLDTEGTRPAEIDCRPTHIGETVQAYGFPLKATHVATWGRVASNDAYTYGEANAGSVVLDLVLVPGNSGGGIFNAEGRLVGIADAVLAVPTGFASLITGLSIMIGSPAICEMLGR